MRASGVILARAIAAMKAAVAPGMTTADVDAVGAAGHRRRRCGLELQGLPRLPGHDLRFGQRRDRPRHPVGDAGAARRRPAVDRRGCILDGWHSDSAVSVHVGEPPSMAEVDLIAAAIDAMWAGIAAARAGRQARRDHLGHRGECAQERRQRRAPVRRGSGIRRARHRDRHAHGPIRPQPRPAGQGPEVAGRNRAGHRTHADPGHRLVPGARRSLDRGDQGRLPGRPCRTQYRDHSTTASVCSAPPTGEWPGWRRTVSRRSPWTDPAFQTGADGDRRHDRDPAASTLLRRA